MHNVFMYTFCEVSVIRGPIDLSLCLIDLDCFCQKGDKVRLHFLHHYADI